MNQKEALLLTGLAVAAIAAALSFRVAFAPRELHDPAYAHQFDAACDQLPILRGVRVRSDRSTQDDQIDDQIVGALRKVGQVVSPARAQRAFRYGRFLFGTTDQVKAMRDALRQRLDALEIESWSIPDQVDWHLVRAEMNGYDFNRRVLMPWVRDPAFYKSIWLERSDVPAHEGPTHHAVVEVWQYDFPLSSADRRRLIDELSAIPSLFQQAKQNLTGNARDLWVTGIRDIRRDAVDAEQVRVLLGASIDDELDAVVFDHGAVDLNHLLGGEVGNGLGGIWNGHCFPVLSVEVTLMHTLFWSFTPGQGR